MRRFCLVALLFCLAPDARAGEIRASDEGVRAALAVLGTPATPEGVARALQEVRRKGKKAALDVATALGSAGGVAAADGLARLFAFEGADVRALVLRSAGKVGLRSKRLRGRMESATGTRSPEVRLAACELIGRLGDGRDVSLLLDLAAAAKDARIRHVAFASLRQLSGTALPNVPARWEHWWQTQQRRADAALLPALRAFERAEAESARLAPDVERYAWVRLDVVEKKLARWLTHGDAVRRTEAIRLVGALRLADLADAVRGAYEFASSKAEREAARATLSRLGVPVSQAETPEPPAEPGE